jgi:hypothetical protein
VVFSWAQNWVEWVLVDFLDVALIFHIGVTFSPLHEELLLRAFDGSTNAMGGAGAVNGTGDAAAQIPVHLRVD